MNRHQAAKGGHVDCIDVLMPAGADVEAKEDVIGATPLILSLFASHHRSALKLIRDYKANRNVKDANGDTPLHWAAYHGHVAVIKELVMPVDGQSCQIIDAAGRNGRTPLHHTCEVGHMACLDELMTHGGADVNVKDNDGQTALHLAAEYNHPTLVNALITTYGARINSTDAQGNTALHLAARRKRVAWAGHARSDVIRSLLSHPQCDVSSQNSFGHTAAGIERELGHRDIAEYLGCGLGFYTI